MKCSGHHNRLMSCRELKCAPEPSAPIKLICVCLQGEIMYYLFLKQWKHFEYCFSGGKALLSEENLHCLDHNIICSEVQNSAQVRASVYVRYRLIFRHFKFML